MSGFFNNQNLSLKTGILKILVAHSCPYHDLVYSPRDLIFIASFYLTLADEEIGPEVG